MEGALVIGISQSGRSPDIVRVIEAGRARGRPTLAITNDPASPLARAAEWVLPLAVGEERAVAATKTYTASLAALALLSASLGIASDDDERRAELERVPELMRRALAGLEPALPRIERYADVSTARSPCWRPPSRSCSSPRAVGRLPTWPRSRRRPNSGAPNCL